MVKFTSTLALLSGALLLGPALVGCSTGENVILDESALASGSVRLALQAGDQTISEVIAVISGKDGFVTQTHEIDVSGSDGVISIFFGNLPVGKHYTITLTAGECTGSGDFEVEADEIALVSVPLKCGVDDDRDSTGGVQVTGTIEPGGARDCDHILKIVAAPSIQNGNGPVSAVELVLNDGVTPTAIAWSTSSTSGASGTIGDLSGATDKLVSFDCSSNGAIAVVANITAPEDGKSCTEQARANIECLNQGPSGPRCGDGIINGTEQCDGSALPPNTPAGTTCSATCTLVPASGPRCGDGIVNGTEQCDGSALPPNTPAGTTCSATCALVPPAGLGACLTCAQANCPTQYANAVGSASDAANLADVTQLFDCVIGPTWELGGPIPQTSCFFADATQPLGSLVPCYCGSTPQATCLATGPANNQDACGLEVEVASRCSPLSASCVTGSGSNPAVPLGDALQLLNCERAACGIACGFPPPVEE